MRIGESHPLPGKLVNMRGLDLAVLKVQAPYIPVAKIIAHNQDNIREFLLREGTQREERHHRT
jgi:hypothetical protein